MPSTATLKRQLDSIRSELIELDQIEVPTDEQATRARELLAEHDTAQADLAKAEEDDRRRERLRAVALSPTARESGDGGASGRWRADVHAPLRFGAAWDRGENLDLRSRALFAVEQTQGVPDEGRARIAAALDDPGTGDVVLAARWTIATSDPAYSRAVAKLLRDPMFGVREFDRDEMEAFQRATVVQRAMNLTDTAGGFLVPFTLDPTIILTNTGSKNPFRRVATIKTTVTDEWNGVTSAGVNAEWLAEAQQAADASPAFLGPKITPKKAGAWIQGSFEVFADSGFATDVGPLITDAKDRLEAAAFATGNGTTQPKGVITAVSAVGGSVVSTITADTYVVGDVYALVEALPARYRAAAGEAEQHSWLAHVKIMNKTRQFDTAGGSSFWANLGMGQPERLLGAPIYEASTMDGVIDAGQNNYILLVGDFKQGFYIVDRIGTTMVYEPLVKGANQRPTGEAGWFAYWRVGSDTVNADAFRLLNA